MNCKSRTRVRGEDLNVSLFDYHLVLKSVVHRGSWAPEPRQWFSGYVEWDYKPLSSSNCDQMCTKRSECQSF